MSLAVLEKAVGTPLRTADHSLRLPVDRALSKLTGWLRMRVSLVALDHGRVASTAASLADAETQGYDGAWLPHYLGADALTVLGAAAAVTSRLTLATGVIAARGRHPVHLWQQAATTSELAKGRLVLGIGSGHAEWARDFGIDGRAPVVYMNELLSVLRELRAQGRAEFDGEFIRVHASLAGERADVPIFVAALGPRMLQMACSLGDGIVTWLADEAYVERVVRPVLDGPSSSRMPPPRLVVQLPACVHDDPEEAKAILRLVLPDHGNLSAYRDALERAGHHGQGPEAVALVGPEDLIASRLDVLEALGVDEIAIAPFPAGPDIADSMRRTNAFFASRSQHSNLRA